MEQKKEPTPKKYKSKVAQMLYEYQQELEQMTPEERARHEEKRRAYEKALYPWEHREK